MSWLSRFKRSRLTRKMTKLFKQITAGLEQGDLDMVEYGNARQGNIWGQQTENKVVYTIEIDLLSLRPVLYKITYDLSNKEFRCHSRIGSKNDLTNVLQFRCNTFTEFAERIEKLAQNIPQMRQRVIKEYLYHQAETSPKRRWLKVFKRRKKTRRDYLLSVAEVLYEQQKISANELQLAKQYIQELI